MTAKNKSIDSNAYIPVIDLSGKEHQLFQVRCFNKSSFESELDKKSFDKDWDPIVAGLRRNKLYKSGIRAVDSIQRLNLKHPFWAITQRLKKDSRLNSQRLALLGGEKCEGESAQLGLALALLLKTSASPIRHVIATGKINIEDLSKENDYAIDSVGGIKEKLQLLIERQDQLPTTDVFFFTPLEYQENGQSHRVDNLPEVTALAQIGIKVKPIGWLGEAAKILQATTLPYTSQDKGLVIVGGFFMVMALMMSLYALWWHQPISVEILKGKDKAEPFLVCSKWDESIVTYQALKRDGTVPLLPVFSNENNDYNSGLGWKMLIKPSLLTPSYHVAFIHMSEKTGFKIIQHMPDSTQPIQWPAQKRLEWYWPMDEVATKQQDNILFVAVQRTPIDADEINQQLTKRFVNTQPFKILAMRDYLITQFPGYYAFTYQSIIDDLSCIEPLH